MSKKSRNLHRKPHYRLPGERKAHRVYAKPVGSTMEFSWGRWFSESRFEISLVVFALAVIFGIWYYGRTKNLILNPLEQTDFIQKQESQWAQMFPGGAKLVVVKRDEMEEEVPLQLDHLPGVKDLSEMKKRKKIVFKQSFLPYDTLPSHLLIPWNNLVIEFSDPDRLRNEEGKILIEFRNLTEGSLENVPLEFSFNRSVGQSHSLMTFEGYHLAVQVIADEEDKLYLLFGLKR